MLGAYRFAFLSTLLIVILFKVTDIIEFIVGLLIAFAISTIAAIGSQGGSDE